MDFGFEAGIGFFLALALCFGVCKIVMVIGRSVALFRRTQRSRSKAKAMEVSFVRHAWDPLDSYEWALRDVANLEQYLTTLPPNEEASATAAQLVAQAKAVVAVCERALRIERIAALLKYLDTAPAHQAKRIAELKADIVAAKKGPLTWYSSKDWYEDEKGQRHYLGPRGLGLSPALIAKAEAELDGYLSFAPGEVDCPDTMAENARLIGVAANRHRKLGKMDFVTGIEIDVGVGVGLLVAIIIGVLAAFAVAIIFYGAPGFGVCLIAVLAAFFAETYRRRQALVRFMAEAPRRRTEVEARHIEENKRLTMPGADASNFQRWNRQGAEMQALADFERTERIRLQRRVKLLWE